MPERLERVVVSGASGLIGSALVDSLRGDGVEVSVLVRRPPSSPDEIEWLTDSQPLDPRVLEGVDAVVSLNGASISRLPWTARYKSTLAWSRLTPTRTLADALNRLGEGAPAFVSASAVGYYGSRPGERLEESSGPGQGFLAELCAESEASARRAAGSARVALLRTASVIHPDALLKPLMLLSRLGIAGPIGRGTQVWPWISLDDEVRAIRHVLEHDLEGPVNLVAPERTTANELGFALARRMNRPYALRAPEWGLRRALGADAAEALLISDAHVVPAVLQDGGFSFRHPTIEEAISTVVPAPDSDPVHIRLSAA